MSRFQSNVRVPTQARLDVVGHIDLLMVEMREAREATREAGASARHAGIALEPRTIALSVEVRPELVAGEAVGGESVIGRLNAPGG